MDSFEWRTIKLRFFTGTILPRDTWFSRAPSGSMGTPSSPVAASWIHPVHCHQAAVSFSKCTTLHILPWLKTQQLFSCFVLKVQSKIVKGPTGPFRMAFRLPLCHYLLPLDVTVHYSLPPTTRAQRFFISANLPILFPPLLHWLNYDPFFQSLVKFTLLFTASLMPLGSVTPSSTPWNALCVPHMWS